MAGFRGSGSWIPEVAACTLLIRYIRENFKIATFSRLSGIRPKNKFHLDWLKNVELFCDWLRNGKFLVLCIYFGPVFLCVLYFFARVKNYVLVIN